MCVLFVRSFPLWISYFIDDIWIFLLFLLWNCPKQNIPLLRHLLFHFLPPLLKQSRIFPAMVFYRPWGLWKFKWAAFHSVVWIRSVCWIFDPCCLCALQVCAVEWRAFGDARQWHISRVEAKDTQSRTNNSYATSFHWLLCHQEYQRLCLSKIIHTHWPQTIKRNAPASNQVQCTRNMERIALHASEGCTEYLSTALFLFALRD